METGRAPLKKLAPGKNVVVPVTLDSAKNKGKGKGKAKGELEAAGDWGTRGRADPRIRIARRVHSTRAQLRLSEVAHDEWLAVSLLRHAHQRRDRAG